MKLINNPHDKFFKLILSHKEIAQDFLSNYLPEDIVKLINISEIAVVKNSFVEPALKETFSDLLYKAKIQDKTGYLYILFEHKSYPYNLVSFQLIKYMTKIWDLYINQNVTGENVELPIIIPMVFYHGKKPWNIRENLAALVRELPIELEEYFPDFNYILYDLSKFNDEELKGTAFLRVFLEVIKYIFVEDINDKIEDILFLLTQLELKETGLEYFEVVLRYLINVREDLTMKSLVKMANKVIPERSEEIMTLADKLREEGRKEGLKEGLKEGIMEGIKEGKEEILRETVVLLLKKKLNLNEDWLDEKMNALNFNQLKKIRDNILDIASIEELSQYIN